ncbi:MAG TPA: hypothetical protein VGC72_18435 [Candidatus Elarobacter sp.]|jgi:hypothetical protein
MKNTITRPNHRHDFAVASASPASDYFTALQQQITAQLSAQLTGPTYLIDAGSQGDFAYNYVNPLNQMFNQWTYDYMSQRVAQGTQPNSIALQGSGSYEQSYLQLVNQLGFKLDTADAAVLQTALNNAQTEGGDVITTYESAFSPISAANLAAAAAALGINTQIIPFTDIDFVIDYVLGSAWSAVGKNVAPLSRKTMANAENLADLLPNMPPDGQPVVALVSQYLGLLGPANQLASQQNYGWWVIGQMKSNLQSGNLATGPGGMQVFDPSNPQSTKFVAAYGISESLDAIQQSLASPSALNMNLAVQQSSSSSSSVSINGGGFFDFGDEILSLSGSASFQYNMTTGSGAGQSIGISLSYAGLTLVPLAPLAWSGAASPAPGSTVGWWSPSVFQQAYANFQKGTGAPSGFTFVNTPNLNLAALPAGNFDNLAQLVVSQYPTISVVYTAGNWNQFSQSFATQTNATVSFCGIPIGSESSSTYSAQANQGSSNESFSVTMTPNSQASIPLNEQRAYVLAGVPFAAAIGT